MDRTGTLHRHFLSIFSSRIEAGESNIMHSHRAAPPAIEREDVEKAKV
jgi:hypothetical protein